MESKEVSIRTSMAEIVGRQSIGALHLPDFDFFQRDLPRMSQRIPPSLFDFKPIQPARYESKVDICEISKHNSPTN